MSSCCVLALVSVKGRVDRPFFFTKTTIAMIINNTIAGTVTDMIRISVIKKKIMFNTQTIENEAKMESKAFLLSEENE